MIVIHLALADTFTEALPQPAEALSHPVLHGDGVNPQAPPRQAFIFAFSKQRQVPPARGRARPVVANREPP